MVIRDYFFVGADMECCCFHRSNDFGFFLYLLSASSASRLSRLTFAAASATVDYFGGLDLLQVSAMSPDLPALVLLRHVHAQLRAFSLPVCDDGIFDLRVVPFLLLPDICLLF